MELQQPNLAYTKLNDDEINSPTQSSSYNQEEENPSILNQRTPISGQEVPNSSSESLQQNQVKELGSCFSIFYKVMLVIFIWGCIASIGSMIFDGLDGLGFDKLQVFCYGWQLVQYIIAFSGVRKRNLGKISNAFFMMKMYYLLIGILFLDGEFDSIKSQKAFDSGSLGRAAINSVVYTIMPVLPTWRVKNIFKTLPEGYNHANEEEIRKEEAQHNDPIEKLGSLLFTVYKYGLLLIFCVQVKNVVSGIIDDFSDGPRFFEKIASNPISLLAAVMKYLVVPLRGVFMFLVFEGIRRKNLEKVLASIKLMKILIVTELLSQVLKEILFSREGKFLEEERKNFEGFEIDSEWFLPLLFVSKLLILGLTYYFLFLYGALRARDILKAHQAIKRTL